MALALLKYGVRFSSGIIEKNLAASTLGSINYVSNMGHVKTRGTHSRNNAFIRSAMPAAPYRTFSDRTKRHHGRRLDNDSDNDSDSDSDSDSECKGKHRGESEFWRRKMRTLHGILDVNKDGVLSYEDFLLLTERFKSLGHLTEEESSEFKSIMTRTWEEQWGEITPYNLVTVEKYLDEMHHVLNDRGLKSKVHHFLPYIFQAVDHDKSGFISVEEFKLFFECLGIDREAAAVSFAIIDINQDGKLSKKEFIKLGKDYFLTENDRKVSRMFWGPLVEH